MMKLTVVLNKIKIKLKIVSKKTKINLALYRKFFNTSESIKVCLCSYEKQSTTTLKLLHF